MSTSKKRSPRRPPSPTGLQDDLGAADLARTIGTTLRDLRTARKMSLEDLSLRSGVSRATLSLLETAKTNPTVAILWKVAAALEVQFSALLGQPSPRHIHRLQRAQQQALRSGDGSLESRALAPPGVLPSVEMYELRFAPRAVVASEPHAPGTHETLVVLAGSVRLTVGEESCDLNPGDSVTFRADRPHRYINRGKVPARCHDLIVYRE